MALKDHNFNHSIKYFMYQLHLVGGICYLHYRLESYRENVKVFKIAYDLDAISVLPHFFM